MNRRTAPLMLLSALMLGACAPVAMQPATSPLDVYGGGLKPIGTPPAIWFSAGTADLFDLVVTIKGSNMRANAPDWCAASGADIVCNVPSLPAGRNFVLPMRGSNISAVATYKRASGMSFSSTARQ